MRSSAVGLQLLVSLLLWLLLATDAASAAVSASAPRCTWIQLAVDAATGPAPQGMCDQSAVYDAAQHRLLVAAGELSDNTDSIRGVWALDFSSSFSSPSWLNLTLLQSDTPAPSPRTGLPAALQPAASAASWSSFLMIGGFDLEQQSFDNETWDAAIGSSASEAVDSFAWQQLATAAAEPLPGLAWSDCAWADDAASLLLMYGGTSGQTGADSGDLWLLDLSLSEPQWQNITAASSGARPPPLSGLRLQRDSARSQLVLFGGYSCTADSASGGGGSACFTNGVWLLSLNASSLYHWSRAFDAAAQPEAAAPIPRAWHSTVLLQDQLWVFGGNYIDYRWDSGSSSSSPPPASRSLCSDLCCCCCSVARISSSSMTSGCSISCSSPGSRRPFSALRLPSCGARRARWSDRRRTGCSTWWWWAAAAPSPTIPLPLL
jgi:hypothetical protein